MRRLLVLVLVSLSFVAGAQTAIAVVNVPEGYATSLDFAIPPLSQEEKMDFLMNGFVATKGPLRFMIGGVEVKDHEFMERVGFEDWAHEVRIHRKAYHWWLAAEIGFGLLMLAVELPALENSDSLGDLSNGWNVAFWASGLAMLGSAAGAGIEWYQIPKLPDFQLVAFKANEKNRESGR